MICGKCGQQERNLTHDGKKWLCKKCVPTGHFICFDCNSLNENSQCIMIYGKKICPMCAELTSDIIRGKIRGKREQHCE